MSEAIKITDHYEEARKLLPSQFYEKPYINAQLKAIADACQDAEDTLYDQVYLGKFVATAIGTDLERIGRLYGINRLLGESDDDLRNRIGAEVLRRNAEGSTLSVKKVMSSYSGLSNMRIFEHSTGGLIVYGETLDQSYELTDLEPQYMKEASPVTTGSVVFGVSYSEEYSNTIIPAELDLTYYNLTVDDAGEQKNLVTGAAVESKNIVVRTNSDDSFSSDSQNAQLAEFTTTTEQFQMNISPTETDGLELNTPLNYLDVSFEGIENDRGVPLQTVQITIDSTVEQIQAAFDEVAP